MRKQLEIILKEDIEKIGKKLQVRSIKGGFYRNCAWLREKIWLFNKENQKRLEKLKQRQQKADLLKEEQAKDLYKKINNLNLIFTLKKDKEESKLFGSVRAEDVLKELEKKSYHLEKRQLPEFAPLTALGDNLIKVKLSESLIAQVKVIIKASD